MELQTWQPTAVICTPHIAASVDHPEMATDTKSCGCELKWLYARSPELQNILPLEIRKLLSFLAFWNCSRLNCLWGRNRYPGSYHYLVVLT